MHVVSDEAIAMDALSKMADCVSSSSDSQLQSVHSVIDLSAASTTWSINSTLSTKVTCTTANHIEVGVELGHYVTSSNR